MLYKNSIVRAGVPLSGQVGYGAPHNSKGQCHSQLDCPLQPVSKTLVLKMPCAVDAEHGLIQALAD